MVISFSHGEGEKYKSADWLRQKYHSERMSLAEIAEEASVTKGTIHTWMKKNGIDRRPPGTTQNLHARLEEDPAGYLRWIGVRGNDPEEILYVTTLLAIAKYGFDAVSSNTLRFKNGIKSDLRQSNIELRDAYHATETVESMDGYTAESDGYVYVLKCVYEDDVHRYVGSTVNLVQRLHRHNNAGGAFTGVIGSPPRIAREDEIQYDIQLEKVESVDNKNTRPENFKRRLRYMEKKEKFDIEQRTGEMCFGGK